MAKKTFAQRLGGKLSKEESLKLIQSNNRKLFKVLETNKRMIFEPYLGGHFRV